MKSFEFTTEEQLKKRLAHIVPPRQLFDATLSSVTNPSVLRSISEASRMSSTYKVTSYIFMKRSYLIGALAVVVVASAAAVYVQNSGTGSGVAMNPNAPTTPTAQTAVPTNDASAQTAAPTNGAAPMIPATAPAAANQSAPSSPSATIDSVADNILQESAAVSSVTANESNDGAAVNADLQNYTDVNNSSYDSTI